MTSSAPSGGKGQPVKRDEVKGAFERLRAALRTSCKGSSATRLMQVVDVLEQNFMSGRMAQSDGAKSELQVVKGTVRRLLKDTPNDMVRMLKAIDGLEDDVVKFLESLTPPP
ncbi:MAG: hypothetical protein HY716_14690 [Planctomycetes bacterium]|nr:hypothetical protein [Planctomycetota bacterium]